jgi:translation initiation factor IF-2
MLLPLPVQILPTCVFNKKDPIVVGVEVVEGIARIGTPLAVPTQQGIELGRIASLELNHKAVDSARAGQSVAMKIEPGGNGMMTCMCVCVVYVLCMCFWSHCHECSHSACLLERCCTLS